MFPVAPVLVAEPSLPVGPVNPVGPVVPVEPVLDDDPSLPVGPVNPVGPVFPVAPVLVAEPSLPVGPRMSLMLKIVFPPILSAPPKVKLPPTNNALLKELSFATVKLAFNEMSLELSNELNRTPLLYKFPDRLIFPLTSTAYEAFAVFPTPIRVPTYNPRLKDESFAIVKLAFNEMSLVLSNELNRIPLLYKFPVRLIFPLTSTAYEAFAVFPTPILVPTYKPEFMLTSPVNDGDAMGALRSSAEVNPVLTIEPPTYRLPLNDESALETKKLPVKVGEALGAFSANEFVTVVENAASLPSAAANSFSVSNAVGALATSALISLRTYAVVAICVLLVPNTAVVAVGVPVSAGDSRGALRASVLVNPVFTIEPPTNKLALNDESEATRRPALNDTSPVLTTEPVKDGAASGALRASAALNPVLTIAPLINKLPLKDESEATRKPAFNETSPVTPNVPCMTEFPPSETEPLLDDIVESPIEIELEPHIM